MEQFFTISEDGLEAQLCFPSAEEGYYRGTRFDHAGIFRKITRPGHVYADEWFDSPDPYRHDNVCGPSEEFVIAPEDLTGTGEFLKIGVGRLFKAECGPYDRFRLFEIADPGERTLEKGGNYAEFTHLMKDEYLYSKRIELSGSGKMTIAHTLRNLSKKKLSSFFYNHNFFTLDNLGTGPDSVIEFPYEPSGHWREVLDNVSIRKNRIVFSSPLQKGGKTAFIGDLSAENPFSFRICNAASGAGVEFGGDAPVSHCVFWSNHRISCVEPYIRIEAEPGETFTWALHYNFI